MGGKKWDLCTLDKKTQKKRHKNKKITSKTNFLLRKLTKMGKSLLNCIKKLSFSII